MTERKTVANNTNKINVFSK